MAVTVAPPLVGPETRRTVFYSPKTSRQSSGSQENSTYSQNSSASPASTTHNGHGGSATADIGGNRLMTAA